MVIGVISDTHGRITESALEALKGSKAILHAGDVGSPEVIKALEEIAPVYAVRGNTDRGMWAQRLPMTQLVELGGKSFYILHDIYTMSIDPKRTGIDVVVYGHSHVPKEDRKGGVLYFNPGSAGPRRFKLPVCLGRIIITDEELNVEWVELE
ncbi:MAG TPA: metallophosphoesterase family protein [Clostridiales bacterium]|nr:metallophosphoesterase family protein [Clostridiales bacterium]